MTHGSLVRLQIKVKKVTFSLVHLYYHGTVHLVYATFRRRGMFNLARLCRRGSLCNLCPCLRQECMAVSDTIRIPFQDETLFLTVPETFFAKGSFFEQVCPTVRQYL